MSYVRAVLQLWKDLKIESEFYHADRVFIQDRSHVQGMSVGVNGGNNVEQYQYINSF